MENKATIGEGIVSVQEKSVNSPIYNHPKSEFEMTNEQALKIVKSKFFSAAEIAVKFYGLQDKHTSEDRSRVRKNLKQKRNFNNAELKLFKEVLIEKLKEYGINSDFFE